MFAIVLENVQVQVGDGPNAVRLLQFTDAQSGITVTIPMSREIARQIGAQLSTGIAVASGPLGNVPLPGSGNGRPIRA